ncbi:class I SAM-dependent methyltransferase [Aureliella helgolandensis]|uniref:Demethylrebeccamycin-D-glucose O-methyltransferase n=1 Tax=Aureliella helgolandensis TaxID=2527968 RepID=A0A518G8J0_9BACT|nr:class I SAM-dependent methyltransferase [Aureliella helgolandensis]QDV24908.1 Demethylrebeccamycin-D-glucose O-methyltransferase [Aureliella helgolandensis]
MLSRVLEPEVMDDASEALAYDEMDHAGINELFVNDFLSAGVAGQFVLDIGTGTARIPVLLCERDPHCCVMAIDAAVSMLEIARLNVAVGLMEHRIQLSQGDSKQLSFHPHFFDAVLSNSVLHHIPKPEAALVEAVRVLKPGGRIFMRDLVRPDSEAKVEALVLEHAAQEPEGNQQLLRQSLFAALTLAEIRELVAPLGFPESTVQMTSDRHWTWDARKPAE